MSDKVQLTLGGLGACVKAARDNHDMAYATQWLKDAITDFEVFAKALIELHEHEAAPEITDAMFYVIDNILCRLATQGRPSQAADAGWHEALRAVRAVLEARSG